MSYRENMNQNDDKYVTAERARAEVHEREETKRKLGEIKLENRRIWWSENNIGFFIVLAILILAIAIPSAVVLNNWSAFKYRDPSDSVCRDSVKPYHQDGRLSSEAKCPYAGQTARLEKQGDHVDVVCTCPATKPTSP